MGSPQHDRVRVFWMMGASCHLALDGGSQDSLALRPNVPAGEPPPVGWQAALRHFPHGREMGIAEARGLFAALGPVTLIPGLRADIGEVAVRAATDALKIVLSTQPDGGLGPLDAEGEAACGRRLAALARDLFGEVRAPGDAGASAWR